MSKTIMNWMPNIKIEVFYSRVYLFLFIPIVNNLVSIENVMWYCVQGLMKVPVIQAQWMQNEVRLFVTMLF